MSEEADKLFPELSIIIPTKDRNTILRDHLAQLINAIDDINAEIIIVNDSKADISKLPENKQLRIVKNPKHGVASARNYGASLASSKLLMFLDDDMIVFKEDLKAILYFHSNHQECFLNLNWIYPPNVLEGMRKLPFGRYLEHYGFTDLKGWNRGNTSWSDEKTFETSGITSQNLSVTKETFLRCGGYSEDFPYAGFEDHEFSKRIRESGCKIYVDPTQITYHDESDRLELKSWLSRKYRSGITRRMAVHKGLSESKLVLTLPKKIILVVGNTIFFPIAILCNRSFFLPVFDGLYFRLVNVLLSIAIYGGYFSKEAEMAIRQIDE